MTEICISEHTSATLYGEFLLFLTVSCSSGQLEVDDLQYSIAVGPNTKLSAIALLNY